MEAEGDAAELKPDAPPPLTPADGAALGAAADEGDIDDAGTTAAPPDCAGEEEPLPAAALHQPTQPTQGHTQRRSACTGGWQSS